MEVVLANIRQALVARIVVPRSKVSLSRDRHAIRLATVIRTVGNKVGVTAKRFVVVGQDKIASFLPRKLALVLEIRQSGPVESVLHQLLRHKHLVWFAQQLHKVGAPESCARLLGLLIGQWRGEVAITTAVLADPLVRTQIESLVAFCRKHKKKVGKVHVLQALFYSSKRLNTDGLFPLKTGEEEGNLTTVTTEHFARTKFSYAGDF